MVHRTNLHIYASVISDDGTKGVGQRPTAEADVRKNSARPARVATGCGPGDRQAHRREQGRRRRRWHSTARASRTRPRQGAGRSRA